MELACLDLEGVLIPEIWIEFANKTGIEELKATPRDIPDYNVLMKQRLRILEENNLKIRVYGESASLEWSQQEPNSLWMKFADQPSQLIRSGVGPMSPLAEANMRTPAGHPEGYIEAFANIYKNFSNQIQARLQGQTPSESAQDVPGIREAVRGMAFIENVVAASQSELKWHKFLLEPQSITIPSSNNRRTK